MSRSTPTERPDVASTAGIREVSNSAIKARGTLLLIGLVCPQSFKDYDSFATLLQAKILLPLI